METEVLEVVRMTTRYGSRYLRMSSSLWFSIEVGCDGSISMVQVLSPRLLEADYMKSL